MAYIGNKPAELAVDIDNASVTTEKLANDAVTAAKIVDGTIIADDLNNGIITNSKVASNAAIAATKLAVSGGSNITLQSDGTFDLDASVDVTGGYSVGGTAVISSSRAGTLTGLSLTGNITKASGDLTLDVAGDIVLNADGGDWLLNDGTVTLGSLQNDGNDNLIVMSNTNNKSIKFLGIDNSNTITALLLDMSEAGAATFNSDVDVSSGALKVGGTTVIDSSRNGSFGTVTASGGSTNNNDNANILTLNASEHARLLIDTSSTGGHRATLALESNGNETQLTTTGSASYLNVASGDLTLDGAGGIIFDTDNNQSVKLKLSGTHYASLYKSNDHFMVYNPISNGDIRLQGKDGSSVITALTLDMSEAGAATFNSSITATGAAISGAVELGSTDSTVGDLRVYDTGNNSLRLFGVGSNSFEFDLLGTGSTGTVNFSQYNVGIGASDTQGFKMRVDGAIKLGTTGITQGSTMLTGNYADGQEGWNIGSEYSTAAIQLMYGVKPSTTAENTYISSADNANWKRSVLKTGENLSFQTAGAQNTSIGTAVALTERFSVLADGRTTITSTASPALQVNSNADSARAIIANTNGTATFSYLELSTSSHGPGYLIKNIANSGNGMNNGSLYLWNSDHNGSGAIEFVPNQTIANRTTVEENGDLSVRGKVAILTTENDGLHIGSTASDYSGYGTGVPTISLQGTNNANRRAGAISFRESDGTVTGAIYSTYGGDGYAGLNFHSKTEAIKFAVGGSSSGPADDIVTIEGGSNKSRLNVNYLDNVYNGGFGGVYAYNGFIGANEISASGSDNDANVRVRVCINTSTSVWRAGYCWVTASSCGSGGQGPVTAWWLYKFRTYNSSIGSISVADSGGDTSSFSVAFSDDGDPDGDGTSLIIGVRVASTHSTANDETTMGIVLGTREGPPRAAERIST